MENEEPKMCTTSGRPVDIVRAEQTESEGQHKDYIVLCPDERAKGFVRPYRDKYVHVGQSICAKMVGQRRSAKPLGGPRHICALPYGHEGGCDGVFLGDVDQVTHARLQQTHRKGGCGTATTMGRALSETYARDPKFYGATFCVGCNKHLPVGEFIWSVDGKVVGS